MTRLTRTTAGTIRIRTRRPDDARHRFIDAEVTDSDWQPPVAAALLSSHIEAALDSIGPDQTVTIDIRVDDAGDHEETT